MKDLPLALHKNHWLFGLQSCCSRGGRLESSPSSRQLGHILTLFLFFYFAGGREVYSQSKARSARHKNRQRHSGEPSANTQHIRGSSGSTTASSSSNLQQETTKVLKETVFSSEIHSIEYNSPIMSSGGSSSDSPKINKIAKNINVDTGTSNSRFAILFSNACAIKLQE